MKKQRSENTVLLVEPEAARVSGREKIESIICRIRLWLQARTLNGLAFTQSDRSKETNRHIKLKP